MIATSLDNYLVAINIVSIPVQFNWFYVLCVGVIDSYVFVIVIPNELRVIVSRTCKARCKVPNLLQTFLSVC